MDDQELRGSLINLQKQCNVIIGQLQRLIELKEEDMEMLREDAGREGAEEEEGDLEIEQEPDGPKKKSKVTIEGYDND